MQQHEEAEESPNSGERHMQALVGVEVDEPLLPPIPRVQVRVPLVINTNAQSRRYLRYLNRMTQTTWEGSLTGTLSHQGRFKTAMQFGEQHSKAREGLCRFNRSRSAITHSSEMITIP